MTGELVDDIGGRVGHHGQGYNRDEIGEILALDVVTWTNGMCHLHTLFVNCE
jgi:hypothetical protein